jgi:RimJ/RimL family protein N-acetyltransferase
VSAWARARTARLWLDLPVAGDVDALFALHADPAVWEHFPSGRHTSREQAVEMVAQSERQFAAHGLGFWSIRDHDGGPVVGRGGCAVPPGLAWWNLYYRFSPSVQRRGYAVEMARTALEAAHDVEPERPVIAYLLEHNAASRRTAERLGLTLAWRGPDRPNPAPDAVRLVYVDREPTADLVAAIEAHALAG